MIRSEYSCKLVFSIRVVNTVDPDQLATPEASASWSGSTMFSKMNRSEYCCKLVFSIRVKNTVDPDQLASPEASASWSGPTMFWKLNRSEYSCKLVFSIRVEIWKTLFILISWFHQMTADLDQQCFQKWIDLSTAVSLYFQSEWKTLFILISWLQ